MDSFYSVTGIKLGDFIQVSMIFFVTMLALFGVKNRKLNYFMLGTFVLQCLLLIIFRDGWNTKLFAGLMLISVVTLELMVNRKRKLQT